MHSRELAHRDLKPENIVLDGNFDAKLCDFGWASEIKNDQLRTSICGTREYMSPEVLIKS